jgi:hypothetical protein
LCYPDGKQSGNKTKRKTAADSSTTNKKAKTDENSEIDVLKMAKSGQVSLLLFFNFINRN